MLKPISQLSVTLQQLQLMLANWAVDQRIRESLSRHSTPQEVSRLISYLQKTFVKKALIYLFLRLLPDFIQDLSQDDMSYFQGLLLEEYNLLSLRTRSNTIFDFNCIAAARLLSFFISSHFIILKLDEFFQAKAYTMLIHTLIGVVVDINAFKVVSHKLLRSNSKLTPFKSNNATDQPSLSQLPQITFSKSHTKALLRRDGKTDVKIYETESLDALSSYRQDIKASLRVKRYYKKDQKITMGIFYKKEAQRSLEQHEDSCNAKKNCQKLTVGYTDLSNALRKGSSLELNLLKPYNLKLHSWKETDLKGNSNREYSKITEIVSLRSAPMEKHNQNCNTQMTQNFRKKLENLKTDSLGSCRKYLMQINYEKKNRKFALIRGPYQE